MPSHEEHCRQSLKLYGKSFAELHRWMDEPSTLARTRYGGFRHDPNKTPQEALTIFGPSADKACLDHIRLDELESRKHPTDEGKEEISTPALLLSSSIILFIVGMIFINFIVQLALPCLAVSVFFFVALIIVLNKTN